MGPGRARSDGAALAAGALVLFTSTALSALAAGAFALGAPLPAWSLPAAALAALGATWALARRSGLAPRSIALGAAGAAALAAASGALALAFLDLTDDGQTYHLSAVIRLAQGWNPWRERLSGSGLFYGWCLDHYPRASWVAGAALYRLSGRVDLAKAPQLALLGAAAALAWAAARALLPGRPRAAAAAALLAAANPVAVVQLATDYVDGLLASALLALAAALVLAARGRGPLAPAVGASAAALACGLKFTGVLFALALAAGAAGVAASLPPSRAGGGRGRLRRALRAAAPAVAGVAAAALLLEANPYLTNVREGGNPFWPVVGGPPGPWSLMAGDEPGEMTPEFARRGRAARLLLSTFARADSLPGVSPGVRLKAPFTVRRSELGYYRWVDTRAAGLGPLFSGALLLALAALALAARAPADRPRARAAALAAAALAASALALPHAWFARYAPQLWLVPAVAFVAAAGAASRAARAMAWAAVAALSLDAAAVEGVHLAGELRGTRAHRAQLRALAAMTQRLGPAPVAFGRSESHRVRLREHGVQFEEGPLPCAEPVQLLSLTDTRLCPPAPLATVVWPG